jgi:hypothetical protein
VNAFDPRLPIMAAEARVKTCHVFHCFQAMREMGKSFHPVAFAQFAGLEGHHVAAIMAVLEAHGVLPGKRAVSSRGQRLPDDFTAPDDWIELAVKERRWSPDEARVEAEIFANYWQAKSGSGAAKLDWRKTWINWYRNSHRPDGTHSTADKPSPETWRDYCKERLEKASAMNWRQGVEEWTLKLRDAEAKLSSNVVPINRLFG